jgi:O-antigen/teichoic acid export membrane protein
MDSQHQIIRNTIQLGAGRAVAQLANFGFVICFARLFGVETLGAYSLAMAVGALLALSVSCGTATLSLKHISRKHAAEGKLLGVLMPLYLLSGCLIFFTVALFAVFSPLPQPASGILIIICAYHLIREALDLISVRFQARGLMGYPAAVGSAMCILILFGGCSAATFYKDPIIAVLSFPLSAACALAFLIKLSDHLFGTVRLNFDINAALVAVVESAPYFFVTLLSVIYARIGVLLLGLMDTDTSVGWFSSAERLIIPMSALLGAFIAAVFPAFSRAHAIGSDTLGLLVNRALRILIIVTLPATTLMFLFSADIIRVLYGASFLDAVVALKILSGGMLLRGLNAFLSMVYNSIDRQKVLIKIRLGSLILFITLAVVLIGHAGYIGLSIAFLATEVLIFAALFMFLRQVPLDINFMATGWRTAASCAVVAVVHDSIAQYSLPAQTLICLLVGVISLFIFGAVNIRNLEIMNK